MKFNQYILNELFDKSLRWKVQKKNDKYFSTSFKILNRLYVMEFWYVLKSYWTISFGPLDDEDFIDYELTNKNKNQFLIFATVIDIFKTFIKEYNPLKFQFSAKEVSRQRLYDRFAKEISKKFGYMYTTEIDGEKMYIFSKVSK